MKPLKTFLPDEQEKKRELLEPRANEVANSMMISEHRLLASGVISLKRIADALTQIAEGNPINVYTKAS